MTGVVQLPTRADNVDAPARPVRALVTESVAGAAEPLVRELVSRGHTVFRCHPGGSDLRCAAVTGPAGCPLDNGSLVDVVVDVRTASSRALTTREYGVVCGRRADVPVVVVGDTVPASAEHVADWAHLTTPETAADDLESVAVLRAGTATARVRAAVAAALTGPGGTPRFDVRVVDHGFFVDVVVTTDSSLPVTARRRLERELAFVVRGHRNDWVHTRLTIGRFRRG